MFFLTPVLAGIILAGTFGGAAYVQEKAKEVVAGYNLATVSHLLEIYNVDHGRYPQSLSQLVDTGEIKNLNVSGYTYQTIGGNQEVEVCEVGGELCWTSY